jgi:hypothetical protein
VKLRFNGSVSRIIRMVVSAGGIRLPYFDHGIVHRRSVAIEDATAKPHPLALGLWTRDPRDRVSVGGQAEVEKRAHGL